MRTCITLNLCIAAVFTLLNTAPWLTGACVHLRSATSDVIRLSSSYIC